MKNLAKIIAAVSLLPSFAFAQGIDSANQKLEISGVSAPTCIIRSPAASNNNNASYSSTGSSSGIITISQLVDPVTSLPQDSSINLAFPLICNSAHRLKVTSSNRALLRNGNAPRSNNGDFRQYLDYSYGASWLGSNIDVQSNNGSGINIRSDNGGAGQVDVRMKVTRDTNALVAGIYSDTLIIELQALN